METHSRAASVRPRCSEALDRLQELSLLASQAGAAAVASDAATLAARTEEGLFYVACLGQFKRGKSTLINALLGDAILPAGVVPVTSIVTAVRPGPERGARIRLASGEWRLIDPTELAAYVSETGNPGNEKGVLAAEVFLPHPLLASGLCLVDTPGLGSIFEANTATTRSFVPHIDVALVVLGADPPISGEELALVGEVARTVHHFLFVLNKADRLSEAERREARDFAERVLARKLGRPVGPVFEVSAAESLAAGRPTRELSRLREALADLAREAGADIVARAQALGLERLAARVLAALSDQRNALTLPLEDSQRRIETLRSSAEEGQRAAGDLAYLFTAEQNRLSESFTAKKEEFLVRAGPQARRKLEAEMASLRRGRGVRRRASEFARQIARGILEEWLPEIEPVSEQLYREAMRRFVEVANGFFERLGESDESLSSFPRQVLGLEAGFRAPRRFYFNDLFELAPSAPRILGLGPRGLRGVTASAGEYLGALLQHNATRIVNDLDERVLESRRLLEAEVMQRLREGLDSAVAALERARARRAAGRQAVEEELARIDSLESRVRTLLSGDPRTG